MTPCPVFTHEHNALEVAAQEWELAERHFREVCQHGDMRNPDHQQRFRDAVERREAARERWLAIYG